MIYKKKRGKKWFSRSYFFLIAGSAPMPGVGLVSCGVSWLGELVPVFWSMELDLVSLKGSTVSSSKFLSVYGFRMSSGFGSVKHVYLRSLLKVALSSVSSLPPAPNLCLASWPLLLCPVPLAEACWVGACVDLFLPSAWWRLVWTPLRP